jgi:hypothetical protein
MFIEPPLRQFVSTDELMCAKGREPAAGMKQTLTGVICSVSHCALRRGTKALIYQNRVIVAGGGNLSKSSKV